jgi:gliding motility-associated-like protein
MRIRCFNTYCLLVLIIVCCAQEKAVAQGFNTKGTDFWFGFMENYLGNDITTSNRMKVFITTDHQQATGTISVPLQGWAQNFVVPPNSTIEVIIPTAIAMCTQTEVVENRGINVSTDIPVTVYQLNYTQYTADGNIVLPTLSLGTRYRATTYATSPSIPLWVEASVSELLVVAAYDSTHIKITPKCNTEGGHGANIPFTIMLNRGEAYQVRAYFSPTYNLSGSLIELDTTVPNNCKTFAVFSGNKCAFVPVDTCCCDHLVEQMMPISSWGRKYITVPLMTRSSDVFRLIGSQNGTIYTINGGGPQGLNAGQTAEWRLSGPTYIESNKPISVAQFSEGMQADGVDEADPFMVMISPVEQTIDRIVFNSFTSSVINSYYVNIVTKTANINLVTLDGAAIGAQFIPVPAYPSYSYARLNIPQGNHVLQSDSGIIAYVYGYGWYESYGYIAGASVKNLDVYYSIVSSGVSVPYYQFTDTICRGTTLSFVAMNNPSITTHYWDFGDGSPIAFGPSVSHTYPDTGTYRLTYYYEKNTICGLDSILWEIHVKCCNPHPVLQAVTPVCVNVNSSILDVSAFNPDASYVWDFGAGTPHTGSAQGPYEVSWSAAQTDTVWLHVSMAGCPDDSAFIIMEISPIPTATFDVASPVCYGEVTTVHYTGNASPMATYYWNFNGGNIISGAGQGPYYVYWLNTGSFNAALDVFENGCPSGTYYTPVTIYPPPYPNFVAEPGIAFIEEPTISFYDYSTNMASWSWNFGDPGSGDENFSSLVSPVHTYEQPGEYTVWLYAVSPDGCVDSVSTVVRIIELFDFYIPNAFTPNADGLNDLFEPFSSSDLNYTLLIFDRWGEQLYEGKNRGWDGKFNGQLVKPDIYAWRLLYSFKHYQTKVAYGRVMLLK